MTLIDYVAIVASFFTIISVCINIIQWRSKKSLVTTLKSRSQAAFNYFFRTALHADRIRALQNSQEELQQSVNTAMQQSYAINGIADIARLDIISYSREHLNFIPVGEHPATPNQEQLPKPKQNRGINITKNIEKRAYK